jgi:predicted DCC family thiol-disulfide oxidoreductase YuxK
MAAAPHLIFYDARCTICQRSRQFVERMRPTAPLRFIDINDRAALSHYPQISVADTQGQMHVLDPAGHVTGGFDAMITLAGLVPATAWLTPILRLRPVTAIGRAAYRWFASNRYMLGGQRACTAETCRLHAARPVG